MRSGRGAERHGIVTTLRRSSSGGRRQTSAAGSTGGGVCRVDATAGWRSNGRAAQAGKCGVGVGRLDDSQVENADSASRETASRPRATDASSSRPSAGSPSRCVSCCGIAAAGLQGSVAPSARTRDAICCDLRPAPDPYLQARTSSAGRQPSVCLIGAQVT